MKFTIINADQRSPEWRRARAGRLTGSRADTVLMKGRKKGEPSKTRRDYIMQLVGERISGMADENLLWTADMQRGIDLEPMAFAKYEAVAGVVVRRTGFLRADELLAGCSLDGDVNGFSGIVELKCPKMTTHLGYIADPDSLRHEYFDQVRHNLWISGAVYCDLISFDDRMPRKRQLLRVRIERHNAELAEYQTAALEFLAECDAAYNTIMENANA
jgi:hypothetical protein